MKQGLVDDFLSLSYSMLLKQHASMVPSAGRPVNIRILSNIVARQIKEPLELKLMLSGINSNISFGNYDNIVQDSYCEKSLDIVIVFWETFNVVPNFHYKAESMDIGIFQDLLEKEKLDISIVLRNLGKASLVIFNEFNTTIFTSPYLSKSRFSEFGVSLNEFVKENKPSNVITVDLTKIFLSLSTLRAVDTRFFYTSKAPYTFDFYKSYCCLIEPFLLAKCGKAKKVLIFDCDNTLWGGILGEDGVHNIEMSDRSPKGIVFQEIQYMALELSRKGIIVGICSKNNFADVQEVFLNHPDIVLSLENITIVKSNWNDKVSNLNEIARELNIGTDSMVFIDDSLFELEQVKESLPAIVTLQTPANIYDYPRLLRKYLALFFNFSVTAEDEKRISSYKEEANRHEFKLQLPNVEDYLSSLDLEINISLNQRNHISRIAQLSQKTNQFNLRTIRYTEAEVINLIDEGHDIFSVSVTDRFGPSGITCICIVKYNESSAFLDTFLLSCRVLGRNVEFKVIEFILEYLRAKKINILNAEYIKTAKNEQVEKFYEKCSFELLKEDQLYKTYSVRLAIWQCKKVNYIKVKSELALETY